MDNTYMEMAINEAKKGKQTWTNPKVGAVIVKNEQVLASGHHDKFGDNHAEVNALNDLNNIKDAVGATLYVTLEPCSHFGKTPPCVRKVVDVGIKRVVIGQVDPNPIVSGRGVNYLKNHGVEVLVLNSTTDINRSYNFFYRNHRPLVTVKYAMSLDGKINQTTGERTLISGEAAYLDSQQLRADNQAILIGENTLRVDDPELTVRTESMSFPPIRIILVRDIDQLDWNRKIFMSSSPIWILSATSSDREFPKNVAVYSGDWTPKSIIELLAKHNIQSLLVEGGSTIHAEFVSEQLVDDLVVYLSPKIFGGAGLPAVFGTKSPEIMNLHNLQVNQLGRDLKITATRYS